MIEITARHLGDESVCLNDIGLIRARKSHDVSTWVVHSDHLGAIGSANICRVTLSGVRELLADMQTGQLYCSKSLRCLSGPLFINKEYSHAPQQG